MDCYCGKHQKRIKNSLYKATNIDVRVKFRMLENEFVSDVFNACASPAGKQASFLEHEALSLY